MATMPYANPTGVVWQLLQKFLRLIVATNLSAIFPILIAVLILPLCIFSRCASLLHPTAWHLIPPSTVHLIPTFVQSLPRVGCQVLVHVRPHVCGGLRGTSNHATPTTLVSGDTCVRPHILRGSRGKLTYLLTT